MPRRIYSHLVRSTHINLSINLYAENSGIVCLWLKLGHAVPGTIPGGSSPPELIQLPAAIGMR